MYLFKIYVGYLWFESTHVRNLDVTVRLSGLALPLMYKLSKFMQKYVLAVSPWTSFHLQLKKLGWREVVRPWITQGEQFCLTTCQALNMGASSDISQLFASPMSGAWWWWPWSGPGEAGGSDWILVEETILLALRYCSASCHICSASDRALLHFHKGLDRCLANVYVWLSGRKDNRKAEQPVATGGQEPPMYNGKTHRFVI